MFFEHSFAEHIALATNEEELLEILVPKEPPLSEELLKKYEGYSPLSLAMGKGYQKLALSLMAKLSPEQFLDSFKSNSKEAQSILSDFFLRLLDFDVNSIPEHIRPIVTDLANRKIVGLLAGLEGSSNFDGIPWSLDGHHNYQYISRVLFQLFTANQEHILEAVGNSIVQNSLPSEIENPLKISIVETIELMQRLTSGEEITGDIIPILVGTQAGRGYMHAEGFVRFGDQFLYVERANPEQPGVIIYQIDSGFDEQKFQQFLEKARLSTKGDMSTALSFETYTNVTTASGHMKEITGGYIPMALQNKLYHGFF